MRRTFKRKRSSKPYVSRKRKRTMTKRRFTPRGGRFKKLAIGAFPNTKTLNLRYVEDFTLNPGILGSNVYVFSINGLFDPNKTGTGHQPMFFDNYMAIYQNYRVNNAYITFIATDTHITNNVQTVDGTTTGQYYAANERAVRMFIVKDKTDTDYSAFINTLIEEGNTNMAWRYAPQQTTSVMPKLRMFANPVTLLNVNKRDDELQGTATSNPPQECYFICGVDSMPGNNADSMNFQVIITYNVTFSNLKKNQNPN